MNVIIFIIFTDREMNDTIKDIIKNTKYLVGILHLSLKRFYTCNIKNKDFIRKEFTPFLKGMPNILVKTKRKDIMPDVYAIVSIELYNSESNTLYCEVIQYLDEIDKCDDYSLLKALSTCNWTKKIDKEFSELINIDLTPNREIINQDIEIYSIDPDGCDDIDDALHCVGLDDGYQIGIHIADVSSYIEAESKYDIELSKRISTVYFSEAFPKINMIPEILSINHMSLKSGSPKRAFTIILNLNKKCDIVSVEFKKTTINVKSNLSYDEFDKNFRDGLLYKIGSILKLKINSAFDDEIYDSHQMVAIYMIYANKLVAEFISNTAKEEVLLRTQSDGKQNKLDMSKYNAEKKLIKKYEGCLNERAYYKIGIESGGHHSMGLESYTHFTSPIRRYADIIVARQLWSVLNNKKCELPDENCVYRMNLYSKMYKTIQQHSEILQYVKYISDSSQIYEAYIFFINNNYIRFYIPDIGMDYGMEIINSKLSELYEIKINDDSIIFTKSGDMNVKLQLFQKIKIKFVIVKKSFEKVYVTMIDPQFFLFQSN